MSILKTVLHTQKFSTFRAAFLLCVGGATPLLVVPLRSSPPSQPHLRNLRLYPRITLRNLVDNFHRVSRSIQVEKRLIEYE